MEFDGGAYGMALLSRWEIMYSRNVRLPDGCVACSCNPFPYVEGRTSMVAAIRSEQTGRKIVFAGVHFYQNDEERLAQAKALAAELDSESGPVILAGDFNSERGSPVMEEFRSRWRILDKQSAPQTIPAFAPDREIDFILVREDSNVEVVSHFVLGESVASDHRPIVADLVFHPAPSPDAMKETSV
jgi:endonuclease/exonuclease/phosphatase family metal-dependent hydrolase